MASVDGSAPRESLPLEASVSQLSMAFVYYSVQLQKAAISKLESQMTALTTRVSMGNEQYAALRDEIASLRRSGQECDKLMAEQGDSHRKYTDAKLETLQAELDKLVSNATARIENNNTMVKEMALVQKKLDEKFEEQQSAINELARADETEKQQEQLVQKVHALLKRATTTLEARLKDDCSAVSQRKYQKLQNEVVRLRQEFVKVTSGLNLSIIYPQSVLTREVKEKLNFHNSTSGADIAESARHGKAVSSSSTASYSTEPDIAEESRLRRGNTYLRLYDKYRRTYAVQKPSSEKRFIRRFLSRMDSGQARYTQDKLLQIYPSILTRLENPREVAANGAHEFIQVDRLSWPQVADAIASMTPDDLQQMDMI